MTTGLPASRRWRMSSTPQRPVDRLARYPAGLPTSIEHRPLALNRLLAINQSLHEPARLPAMSVIKVMTELRPREDATVKTYERDPFRVGSGPAERFQLALSSPQVLDHLLIAGDGGPVALQVADDDSHWLNTIKSGGISSRNRNCGESVQRSRPTSFAISIRTKSKSAVARCGCKAWTRGSMGWSPRSASCANAWRTWKACARPSAGGRRPARGTRSGLKPV